MDDQLKDGKADQQPSIDPLRRVFVPIEKRTSAGTLVFRTTDKMLYFRAPDGSIRHSTPKVNGKLARKARQEAQRRSTRS